MQRASNIVGDRKSTRLNSSHEWSSYAVFCLKKKRGRTVRVVVVGRDGSRRWKRGLARMRQAMSQLCYSCHLVPDSTLCALLLFFFNDPATTEIYTLSLHDALPISPSGFRHARGRRRALRAGIHRQRG